MQLVHEEHATTARGRLLHQGKAKRVYATADPTVHIIEYTDTATAFNGEKRDTLAGKGEVNNRMTAVFFQLLESRGVPTHFLRVLSPTAQLVRAVEIVPLEVVARNVVAGSLAKRTGLPEGTPLDKAICEFYYKRDDLGDPLLTRAHIAALDLADGETLDSMQASALCVNEVLCEFLEPRGITLVDFKLEFGITASGALLLADEISPDTCRFWDTATGRKMDKDRFRRDLGGVEAAYAEMLNRVSVTA